MFTWSAMRSPLCSSATPPASVTAAEIAKTIAVRVVDGAAALFFAFECFIGSFWPSGATPCSCHGRPRCARRRRNSPASQIATINSDAGSTRPCVNERRRAVRERADRAEPDGVEHDEDDGLDRDAAEDVPDRDAEVVRERGARRDRDLGQVRRQRQDHEPADRLAEAEPVVEHVGRVREVNARDPDGGCGGEEHEHEKRERHAAVAFAA
jgi:hypothetical protein